MRNTTYKIILKRKPFRAKIYSKIWGLRQSTQITIRHRKILQNVKRKTSSRWNWSNQHKKTLNNKFFIIISFLPLILVRSQITLFKNFQYCLTKFSVLSLSIVGAYPVYARSPSLSQRPAPTTIASRSPFPLGLCFCSTSLNKMGT